MAKARVKVLNVENISGTSKANGRPYNMNVAHVLDLDTFDKMRLTIPETSNREVSNATGKEGLLDFGVDPKNDKPYFVGFKVAA